MNIIIVGGGKIGTTILERLVTENHNVVAVDSDPEVINEISNIYDVMCVCGNGVDWETLTEAGAQNANLLIAVTGSDEFNMLCCFMAKKIGVPNVIARIRNPEYNDKSLGFIKQTMDISLTINPDAVAAKECFNLLQFPEAESIETFSRRNFDLLEFVIKPGSKLSGMSLMEMRKKYPASYLVGIVKRDDQVIIPDGSFVLQSGDKIGVTATLQEVDKLLEMIGITRGRAKNVMIVGAGRYAFYLTKMLLSAGISVTVIDKNKSACEFFANALPGAVVICGDAADKELLMEEGLLSMDAFVALTGNDEENILLSYLATTEGVKKTITKVDRPELNTMAEKLGLDCILTPKKMISDILTRFARALENSMGSKIETLYKLMDGKAEAIEFIAQDDLRCLNTPLKEMKLKKNILIAGIIRNRKAIIPSGNDVILPQDHVVVLTTGRRLNDLSDITE